MTPRLIRRILVAAARDIWAALRGDRRPAPEPDEEFADDLPPGWPPGATVTGVVHGVPGPPFIVLFNGRRSQVVHRNINTAREEAWHRFAMEAEDKE